MPEELTSGKHEFSYPAGFSLLITAFALFLFADLSPVSTGKPQSTCSIEALSGHK